jgi:predicted esterase
VSVVVLVLVYITIQTPGPLWYFLGKIQDKGNYLIYTPAGMEPGKTYPLVFALSPSADAQALITAWAQVAEKHKWIVAASKTFKNGQDFLPSLSQVASQLNDVEKNFPINKNRVIFSGISGGGMASHAFSKFYPGRVSAIVINTGMMAEGSKTADYPQRKLAVFLASPTDFRYNEMKRDNQFLQSRRWKTKWMEFSGGHTMAPLEVYAQAADWLEANLP